MDFINDTDSILDILYSIAGISAFVGIIQQWIFSYKNRADSKEIRTINEIDFYAEKLMPVFDDITNSLQIDLDYFMENRSLIIKDFDSSELADLKLIPDYVKNVKPIIDSNQQYQTKIYNYLNRLESLCFKINKNHISEELTYSIMAKNIIISISVLYPYFLWAGRKKDTKSTVPFSELISVYEKFSKLINQEKRIEMSMKIRENLL